MIEALALGMVLDALMGEPRWLWSRLPHPAVLMGRAVAWVELRLNQGSARRSAGCVAVAFLVLGAGALGAALEALPGYWAEVLGLGVLLAQRSLADHVGAVAQGLQRSLTEGRREVSKIVGRDVSAMQSPQVARAAIESAAENLSDGVIAPLFWFAVAGMPGLLIYKITNTADSMIGYRTPRYREFGWAAARFDDLINLIPARLTALLLWLPFRRGRPAEIAADARLHRSPNAGWPEAAMARALNVALSGPRSYDGQMRDFPWVHGDGRREIGASEITAAVGMLWRAWGIALLLVAGSVIIL